MIKVQILDYGLGNIKSLYSALRFLGYEAIVDSKIIKKIDLLIIPGVGSFGMAMNLLEKQNLINQIKEYSYKGYKLLGVCLGMQLFFNGSEESQKLEGLKLIDGVVEKLPLLNENLKLPNINWSKIKLRLVNNSKIFEKLNLNSDEFYFLHSYFCKCENIDNIVAYTSFGDFNFCSIVQKNNIFGFQFHPEKSRTQGLKLIKNIIFYTDGILNGFLPSIENIDLS